MMPPMFEAGRRCAVVLVFAFAGAAAGVACAQEALTSRPEYLPQVKPDRSYLCLGPELNGTQAQMDFASRTGFFTPPKSWERAEPVPWSDENKAMALEINHYVNTHMTFVTDIEKHGKDDIWEDDWVGDCDDSVIKKYKMLRAAGFNEFALRITVAHDGTEGHAVLVIRVQELGVIQDVVLDNKRPEILTVDATGYTFYGVTPMGDKSRLRRVIDCPWSEEGGADYSWAATVRP
jgi:predicted transglutaminase-like cysteine proteinase